MLAAKAAGRGYCGRTADGGGATMAFTYLFGTRDVLIHAVAAALTVAVTGFAIFALEHPFFGCVLHTPSLRDLADSDVAELNHIAVTLKTEESGPNQIRRQLCRVYHTLAVQRHTDAILVHSDFERVPVPL